ncbi:exocyst complex component 4-like [Platysternon megacephalum]|uniref:Exocyst complex component 4-like n=1 Tax=Platysternon megacephalum TaxID=55544 RepID=A0A4D9ERD5_9SAUR|nr:exocyst complex component 4-like [Platysternon megacephalum]
MEAGLFLAALLLSCTPIRTRRLDNPGLASGPAPLPPDASARMQLSGATAVTNQQLRSSAGDIGRDSASGEATPQEYRPPPSSPWPFSAAPGHAAPSTCPARQSLNRESWGQQGALSSGGPYSRMWNFQLNVSSAGRPTPPERKVLFVIICDKYCIVTNHSADLHPTFVSNNKVVGHMRNVSSAFNDTSGELLVQRVKEHYGGITSFTELENPHHIHFRVGEDASSPEDCIVQPGFSAQRYLQTEFLVQEVKGCTSPGAKKGKEAHILRVQQGPEETSSQPVEVKVNVVCPGAKPLQDLEILLILQSQPNVTWNIDMQRTVSIMASGKYWITTFPSDQLDETVLPDNEQGLIGLARKRGFDDIASYTDIPSATHVTLELHRCEPEVKTPPPTPAQHPKAVNIVQTFFSLLTPWKCTDDSIEIVVPKMNLKDLNDYITDITLQDPRCRAEQNQTHFVLKRYLGDCHTKLESGILARNKLILTLASSLEKVEVPFACSLPLELCLQLYRTQDFKWPSTTVLEVNKAAYVQVSFRAGIAPTLLEVKECSLQTAAEEPQQLLIPPVAPLGQAVTVLKPTEATLGRELHRFSFVYSPAGGGPFPPCATLSCRVAWRFNDSTSVETLEVMLQDTRPPPSSLGIEAVVGITFAAFLIGTLLTAALWCIYSHTRPMAKLQPVATNAPASESSSPNHSIGSTQSTPCSTSSMA